MTSNAGDGISVGRYTGAVACRYCDAGFMDQLANLKGLIEHEDAKLLSSGRNRNIRITLQSNGRPLEVAVKAFGRQFVVKDRIDVKRGSKARRTWLAASCLAARGVGTPPPIGFLECWSDGRLVESYYLCEYQRNITSFKDELIRLFMENPECERFMTLMQCVASAVRAMHETGFQHCDLGNQNILLRRMENGTWGDVQFVDLNRGRVRGALSLQERARDISRIYLPSDLMRVFKEMYFSPATPPDEFLKKEESCRRLYALHTSTRSLRHPFRTMREKKAERTKADYPAEKDMWIWDERSGQPISVMRPKDRLSHYGVSRPFHIAAAAVSRVLPAWNEYSALLKTCYQTPVKLVDRIGVAINPKSENADREIALLKELGTVPAFVRFYAHEGEKAWSFLAHMVKTLHGDGHMVSVALVQDRRCVLDPGKWAFFVSSVLERVNGHVECAEIGHAVNRVKWGIWNFSEHRRLLEAIAGVIERYPDIKFIGPAVIDFEYPFLMAALDDVPEKLHLSALSSHLYVDRRGAPENRQGRFSSLEKFALIRAIARCSPMCDDRVVVTEVNWPLRGTGVYSPVGSPYESPGPRFNDPSVSEDEYADFMLRYLLMAICSGMVDRVFWWRLVARGYGLVDDTDAQKWRRRPAYQVLKYFLSVAGEAEFMEKPVSGMDGVHLFVFKLQDGGRMCVAYSTAGEVHYRMPFEYLRINSAMGEELPSDVCGLRLSGRPVYLFLK